MVSNVLSIIIQTMLLEQRNAKKVRAKYSKRQSNYQFKFNTKSYEQFHNSFICYTVNFGLPPTYLSIEGHQDCMGSRDMGDFTVACLYQIQPENCKDVAWSWLKQFTGSEKIPTCNENGRSKYRILNYLETRR